MKDNLEFNCECDSVHNVKTKNIIVKEKCILDLIQCLEQSKYENILIFYSLSEVLFVEKIKESLTDLNKTVNFINLQKIEAQVNLVNNIEDKGQDVVLAIGDERLISLAKYYAYMYDNQIIIYPIGEFLDFSFSKYARLNDGVFYDFYLTTEPEYIFVDTSLNKYNELQTNYISSKYIALFDFIVRECVYKYKVCNKIKTFLKKSLLDYVKFKTNNKHSLNIKNIWLMIRLGQAMSFFSQTKSFFGGDKAIVDILQSQFKNMSYLEAEFISLRLINNLYSCFFKSHPTKNSVNLNLHLKNITELLRISPVMAIGKMAPSEYIVGNNLVFSNFSNYFPYLKSVFFKCQTKIYSIKSRIQTKYTILQKFKISHKRLEKSFALAPCIYHVPCSLHLFSAFGYLDKLL